MMFVLQLDSNLGNFMKKIVDVLPPLMVTSFELHEAQKKLHTQN